ncbi:MAG: NRAMP family divalent metal transporter [Lysobacterales bacterium]
MRKTQSSVDIRLRNAIGPGILFAGAAIGTSHLVQSTRAGAVYGLGLLGMIILTNIIKYPAFRFGPQYAAATGKSLLHGYADLGRWVTIVYLLSEVAVGAIVLAATAVVTAAIFLAVTALEAHVRSVAVGLVVLAGSILGLGGFRLLDMLTKLFVVVLTMTTLIATALALPQVQWEFSQTFLPISEPQTFAFVVAVMGFMPSALNLSVLQSLWSVAKQRETGVKPTLSHAMVDFNVGYLTSAALAVCFLLMGASVLHSAGVAPADGAAAFAGQVIALYTQNLGDWAGGLVGISAAFVMFSTLITVLDGFPRLFASGIHILGAQHSRWDGCVDHSPLLYVCTAGLSLLAIVTLLFLMGSFKNFIDFVTITAFLVGPINAILNHLVIRSPAVSAGYRPGRLMQWWSGMGIIVMLAIAVLFVYVRFN